MMNITLFGATGKTGPYLINEGLKRGYEITVVARTTSTFEHPGVRLVRGKLTDVDFLRSTIRGSSAVLSALGPATLPHPKDTPITKATEAIMATMKQEGVNRLIAISTGTAVDPEDGFDWKIWLPAKMIQFLMPSVYHDIISLAAAIRASQLEWTMVRLAVLKDRPISTTLNAGAYGHTPHSFTISREEVATFMFDQITSRSFIHKAPGISSS